MIHKAWCSIEEVPYYFSGSSIKFQGHSGWKIDDMNSIWVRLLCRSQLSNPSDLPGQGHSSNFKVTRHKKWSILTQIERFWTVTPVLYSPMALKWCTKLDIVQKRCPIVFPGHPTNWRLHRPKNWFESNFSKLTGLVTAIKSLRLALFNIFCSGKAVNLITHSHKTKNHLFWPRLGVAGL